MTPTRKRRLIAVGLILLAVGVAAAAVRSCRTISTWPARMHGGVFSVALSLGSPPPDVIRHRSSLEPGLSSPAQLPAQQRSPNPLAIRALGQVAAKKQTKPWRSPSPRLSVPQRRLQEADSPVRHALLHH